MEKNTIAKINGIEIFAETYKDGITYVPIKPICTAIGIDYSAQYNKIQADESLSSTIAIIATVGADEKERDMVAIPVKYIYGWLFSINPGKVAPEVKKSVLKYRNECYDILYDHFTGNLKKTNELNKAEIDLLEQLRKKLQMKKEITNEIKSIEKSLDDLRNERLDPTPSLFD